MLTGKLYGILYVGTTSDLMRRIWEHKNNVVPGFTKRYGVHQLIWFEAHDLKDAALQREKRHGRFETGPMQPPLGQGAMFQIYFQEIGSVLTKLSTRDWPIYLGPREVWRRAGDREVGQQEVFVQDPDGYLLMLAQSIGER